MRRLDPRFESVPDDDAARARIASVAAEAFGAIVLLKGHRTVITDGTRTALNRTGDSTLSKAGAGDVLAGLIGSLIGQGMSAFDAAVAGAWIHGVAGERVGRERGRRGGLAREVCDAIPKAMRDYGRERGA
jgi:NAD(P)H-hydrate epimerase